MSSEPFDVVVIGAGAAGENVAGKTAAAGLSTAIVEAELVGGECSYWACMPSKALLRPHSVLAAARRVPGAAAAVSGPIDVEATLAARDEAAAHFDDSDQQAWVEAAGVTLIRGRARLDGERRVVVATDRGDRRLTASAAVVIATGSHPVSPPIDGLADCKPWHSREITSAKTVPGRLAIIGGGTVSAEMAQAWASLGSAVTVLVRGDRFLAHEEPFAGEQVLTALRSNGIDMRMDTQARSVRRSENREVTLELDDGSTLTVDEIVVATGRKPNTVDLGVDSIGLTPGDPITVDDQLRATGVKGGWLYAVGDVNGRALFTHQGKYQARIAGDVIAGRRAEAWADHLAVPGVTFTDPQVASVGRRLAAAREAGIDVKEVKVPLSSAAAASIAHIEGTAQLVFDQERKVVVGATFVGPDVGEMLQAATIAIVGEVTIDRLWHAVPAYPTISEVWLRLLEECAAT